MYTIRIETTGGLIVELQASDIINMPEGDVIKKVEVIS